VISVFNKSRDVVGYLIGGLTCDKFEYLVGKYTLKNNIIEDSTNIEQYIPPRAIRVILPTTPIPFCIHENSLSNISNSIMSRNFRQLNDDIDNKSISNFGTFCKGFLKNIEKSNDDDYMDMDTYLKTRKSWPLGKKEKFKSCALEYEPYCYKTSLFVKNEMIFKSPLKAPRLINNPQQIFKSKYCAAVFCATQKIKKQLIFDSHFNKTSDQMNFIWTSGMNRDQIGIQCTKIIERLHSLGYEECYIISTDYSKFEATQIPNIINKLSYIYKNISSGEIKKLLVELNQFISGKKKAYVEINNDYSKYQFYGTRSSGDATTTLGNTLLGFALAAWLLNHMKLSDRKLCYLLQAGDDGTLIIPKHLVKYTKNMQKDLFNIGMKLELIETNRFELSDYNSSILLWCTEDGNERLHLSAKLGRLIGRVGYTHKIYTPKQLNALRYSKALCMVNECKLFPGVQQFYMKLVSKYSEYSTVKIQQQYKELITVGDIKPNDKTIHQLMRRYDISLDDYNLFNDVFSGFDPDKLFITHNSNYYRIRDIMKKIIQIDCVYYTKQDLDSFYDENVFDPSFMSEFINEIHDENQYVINLIQ
jgi:hypothetical protein